MPTADRRGFIPAAIRLFLDQNYVRKELVIVDDGVDRIENVVPHHPDINYVSLDRRLPLGTKRNIACELARGELILHWDDDDWHAPWRLSCQAAFLESGNFDVCGLEKAFFVNASAGEAWEYCHPPSTVPWLCGATLCYRKAFWERHRFADVAVGEDSKFVFAARGARIGVLRDNRFFVARIHRRNTCPKRPRDARWQARSVDLLRSFMGEDWGRYFGGPEGLPLK